MTELTRYTILILGGSFLLLLVLVLVTALRIFLTTRH